jgi:hypothetical protein
LLEIPFHEAVISGNNKQLEEPSSQTQEVAFVVVHCAYDSVFPKSKEAEITTRKNCFIYVVLAMQYK